MKRISFKITILASKEKVWAVLWNKETYEKWASVFSPGSTFETDWKEGSKVHFSDGKGHGMYSIIERMIPNEYMSFKHLGILSEGKELPVDEESKKWSGCMENYLLKESGNSTEVTVEIDVVEEYLDYFEQQFPKGLKILKRLAEDLNPNLLRIKAAIQIQKPIHEVFEAIVNPEIMVNYFISYGSDRMEEEKEVIWRFPEFEDNVPIRISKIEKDKYISFYWDNEDKELFAEIQLESGKDNSTIVRATEKSMENNEAGIAWLTGNTEGWANFLACMKAWLEYGVHLRKGAFDFMKNQ